MSVRSDSIGYLSKAFILLSSEILLFWFFLVMGFHHIYSASYIQSTSIWKKKCISLYCFSGWPGSVLSSLTQKLKMSCNFIIFHKLYLSWTMTDISNPSEHKHIVGMGLATLKLNHFPSGKNGNQKVSISPIFWLGENVSPADIASRLKEKLYKMFLWSRPLAEKTSWTFAL